MLRQVGLTIKKKKKGGGVGACLYLLKTWRIKLIRNKAKKEATTETNSARLKGTLHMAVSRVNVLTWLVVHVNAFGFIWIFSLCETRGKMHRVYQLIH